MKAVYYVVLAGLAVGGALAAVVLYRKKGKSRTTALETQEYQDTEEAQFVRAWSEVLTVQARVYNGLFNGLFRVQSGKSKRPEKTLREWCQRTKYAFENQEVDVLCREKLQPLIEAVDGEGLSKRAKLLLNAAKEAGITRETAARVVLTEDTVDSYIEWDGEELNPEDEVEIITPAWYQNGTLLEQGQCKKLAGGEGNVTV